LHYANAELVESACIDVSAIASMINEDGLVADPAVRETLRRLVSNLDNRREPNDLGFGSTSRPVRRGSNRPMSHAGASPRQRLAVAGF
jgi:hypothetical protein